MSRRLSVTDEVKGELGESDVKLWAAEQTDITITDTVTVLAVNKTCWLEQRGSASPR